jgi:hypothetical protein
LKHAKGVAAPEQRFSQRRVAGSAGKGRQRSPSETFPARADGRRIRSQSRLGTFSSLLGHPHRFRFASSRAKGGRARRRALEDATVRPPPPGSSSCLARRSCKALAPTHADGSSLRALASVARRPPAFEALLETVGTSFAACRLEYRGLPARATPRNRTSSGAARGLAAETARICTGRRALCPPPSRTRSHRRYALHRRSRLDTNKPGATSTSRCATTGRMAFVKNHGATESQQFRLAGM